MSRLSGAGVLLLAGSLLALTWLTLPVNSPPLYDGLQTPTEPYRYIQPPPGQEQPGRPPTSARMEVPALRGKSPLEIVATSEQPAQAHMTLQYNAIHLPAGVSQIVLVIRPVTPPAPPDQGTFDGNVYRFTASSPGGAALSLNRGPKTSIELRGTGAFGSPVIEHYSAGHWIMLDTLTFVNSPYYVAYISSFGYFALVFPHGPSKSSGSPVLPFVIIGVAVIALMVVGLLLIRLRRTRSQAPHRDSG